MLLKKIKLRYELKILCIDSISSNINVSRSQKLKRISLQTIFNNVRQNVCRSYGI
jgi:hypothetical protein